jgi:hypothetical protein
VNTELLIAFLTFAGTLLLVLTGLLLEAARRQLDQTLFELLTRFLEENMPPGPSSR